jgi:PAS domain-containing protein
MRFVAIDSITPDAMDFLPRDRRSALTKLIALFVIAGLSVFLIAYTPLGHNIQFLAPLVAVIFMAFLCWYCVHQRQIDNDLVMTAEFQNLLYAQAAVAGAQFVLIVRRDGTVVHVSDGLTNIFPRFDYAQSQALEGLFDLGVVRKVDRERILGSIYAGTQDHLIFPILQQYSEPQEYILTIEPLQRPSGFAVVRGRQYHGQRSGTQMLPDMLRSTSVDKLDHMLSTTTIGHFTADAFGQIEYTNPAFDRAMGYAPGYVVDAKLSLHHLFFSLGGKLITEESTPADYTGEAMLVQPSGPQAKAYVAQSVMRDASGKIVGVTGTVSKAG